MKTLLIGINSKYIHTCLAIWYLKTSIGDNRNVEIREFTINDNKDNILSAIYLEKPDILAFSCYIWNIELIGLLTREIKKLLPDTKIILGGPEVSYSAEKVLEENQAVDFVLCGEGEEAISVLLNSINDNSQNYKALNGIAFREGNTIIHRQGFNLIPELDRLISPYTDELLSSVKNRIVYYESSRGCPFSCSYCISSTFNGVRFFSLDRVKKDLGTLLMYKPKLIKFVDRTFNCNKKRAKEILEHIISLECNTVFHFEAAADLFDEELLELLYNAPRGRIQLEIGLQTTNESALAEIDRVTDLDKLKGNVHKLQQKGNIHIHLDLIAGLPFEDINSFRRSFNDVYNMRPQQLQLGFLKMLKGSRIRKEAEKHSYSFRSYAPYEVLENKYISYKELLELKDIEEVVERYFNSNRYFKSLELLQHNNSQDAFEQFKQLAVYCRENGYLDRPISYRENITILYNYIKSSAKGKVDLEEFRQTMVYDFLSSDSSGAIPEELKSEEDMIPANRVHELLRSEELVKTYLPDFIGLQTKNILKRVFLISLKHICNPEQIILFDYSKKDPVTGRFSSINLNIK